VIGVPTMTLVKGKIVMQDGKITGQPGDGEWAKRGK
jgi:dihydroorotase-like cyclic amidohydrolase